MADNIAGDAAFLGGVEIVNVARTIAYLNNGLAPANLVVQASCGCPDLFDIIGCEPASGVTGGTGYTDPATDDAPWYSEDHPESAQFAGFYPVEFDGMSSTFEREVSESIGNGGIFNRSRAASRSLTWTGYLFGANCCAVAYGLRWLTKTLQGSGQCNDCFGDDLELLVCCPSVESTTATPNVEAFRTLKGVGLTEGPEVISERRLGSACEGSSGCGGAAVMEIEFTLVATNPWFYRAEVPLYNCIPFTDSVPLVTDEEVDCPPVNCGDAIDSLYKTNRGCPDPALPPPGEYVSFCNDPPPALTHGLYLTIPRSAWREFEEAVPYIVISTGATYAADLTIGIYTSNSEDPCGEILTEPPFCNAICDKLTIRVIPANAKFVIDGRTRKMSVICGDGSAFPGEPYTTGPWSWPTFDCFGFCLEIASAPNSPDAGAFPFLPEFSCVSLSMIPRSL